jgi:hypothetical protein
MSLKFLFLALTFVLIVTCCNMNSKRHSNQILSLHPKENLSHPLVDVIRLKQLHFLSR